MEFNKLEAGTQLYLNVKCKIKNKETGACSIREIGLKTFILDTDAISGEVKREIPSGFRVCSNIVVNGYIITFDNSQIDISIIAQHKAKNYKYLNCAIETIVVNRKKYLCVRALNDGVEFNLRKAFRVSLNNAPGNFAQLPSMVQHDCRVLDLSLEGIGLLIEDKYDIALNDNLEIQFKTDSEKEGKDSFMMYTIRCKVIRIEPKQGYIRYGCRITSAKNIEKLVMNKQRENLKLLVR